MAGNVQEWTRSIRSPYPFNEKDESYLDYWVVRGGSWFQDPDHARAASRDYDPGARSYDIGFRVVVLPPKMQR
jgi:formylglycine-generating enzyme required for sulfatase activity